MISDALDEHRKPKVIWGLLLKRPDTD